MTIFSDLQIRANFQTVAVILILLFSAIVIAAQNAREQPTAIRPAPPFSAGAGMGAATGAGMGAATGAGMGAATGRGFGLANGTGIGVRTADIEILQPSAINVLKTRQKRPDPAEKGRGSGTAGTKGRSVAAEETTAGIGEGSITPEGAQEPVEKAEPKRDYVQEIDGKCFYVTNLGEKVYVPSSKCKIE
jgi:hypothetical protein